MLMTRTPAVDYLSFQVCIRDWPNSYAKSASLPGQSHHQLGHPENVPIQQTSQAWLCLLFEAQRFQEQQRDTQDQLQRLSMQARRALSR
jgi:hypothetical protein